MIKNNNFPIIVFDIEDFLPNKDNFIEKTKHSFYDLPWDWYDARKNQLHFLQKKSDPVQWDLISPELIKKYYLGQVDISLFQSLINKLKKDDKIRFEKIKPFRRRSAMRLLLKYHPCVKDWSIDRVPCQDFSQDKAKIESKTQVDYRVLPRQFSETFEEIVDDTFYKLVKSIANLVKSANPEVKKLDITTHHTYVEATQQTIGDNSPEGIHQDGYDYIVSALVIERKNIVGGVSQIFADDKKTRLLATKLHPGQGILQPDHGTSLWHNVTPFTVVPQAEVGHRSSIGFDIGVV